MQPGAPGDDVDLHFLVPGPIMFDHVGGVVERKIHHLRIVLVDLNRDAMRLLVGGEADGGERAEQQGRKRQTKDRAHLRSPQGRTRVKPFSVRVRICATPTCTGMAAGMNAGRLPVSRSMLSTVFRQTSNLTPCAIRLSTRCRLGFSGRSRSMPGPNVTTSIAILSGSYAFSRLLAMLMMRPSFFGSLSYSCKARGRSANGLSGSGAGWACTAAVKISISAANIAHALTFKGLCAANFFILVLPILGYRRHLSV